jgi:hypothetical protein
MAPMWCAAYRGDIPIAEAHLSDHADPACRLCNGTGAEPRGFFQYIWPSLNLCQDNAASIFAVIGAKRRSAGRFHGGSMDDAIAACRAALAPENAMVRAIGIRPGVDRPRVWSPGLNDHDIQDRIRRLLTVLTTAKEIGKDVVWE